MPFLVYIISHLQKQTSDNALPGRGKVFCGPMCACSLQAPLGGVNGAIHRPAPKKEANLQVMLRWSDKMPKKIDTDKMPNDN